MHLVSAIPDITYDREAGIRTTAVVLGQSWSLAFCCIVWSAMAFAIITLSGMHPASFLSLAYPVLPLSLILYPRIPIERVYWFLPYLNTFCGGLVFLLATVAKSASSLF
jgi:4-hydroxybenzoate polyprenyltransferase